MENYDKLVKEYLKKVEEELKDLGFTKKQAKEIILDGHLRESIDENKTFMHDNSPKDAVRITLYNYDKVYMHKADLDAFVEFTKDILSSN